MAIQLAFSSPSFRRRPACMDAGGRAASGTGGRGIQERRWRDVCKYSGLLQFTPFKALSCYFRYFSLKIIIIHIALFLNSQYIFILFT